MNEINIPWNNNKNQFPTAWNSFSKGEEPKLWSIRSNSPEDWTANHNLPDNWGEPSSSSNAKQPASWSNISSLPECWGNEYELSDEWGKAAQLSSQSARGSAGTGVDFKKLSDQTRAGAEKLGGIAKRIGATAKNAGASAVGYARSDEVKEKLNAAKNKAQAITSSAGENASNFIDDKKKKSALTDASETVTYNPENVDLDKCSSELISSHKAVSSDIASENGIDYFESAVEENYEHESSSNSMEHRRASTTHSDHNSDSERYYQQPQNRSVPQYVIQEQKSPIIPILVVVLIIFVLAFGIVFGILLSQRKNNKSSDNNIAVSDVTVENNSTENTNFDDFYDEYDSYSIEEAASYMCKAANSALCDLEEKYELPSTGIMLFSSDVNYRFYSDDAFIPYADEFISELKMYFEDADQFNYILEISDYVCPACVVENSNGEIGRCYSYNYDALFIPNSNGTFKEIAEQAFTNAKEYSENQTVSAITGNQIKFYSSDRINDYPVYLEKLSDLQTNGIYRDQDNGFFLCDINGDNIPELFVTFNTVEPSILFAGSVYSGELVPFAEFMGAGVLLGITLFDNGAIGITSGGNEGYGISYKYYSGGNSFYDQNNNDEYISYIYENGSLSYISYQNGTQEKSISEVEAEQIQQKYVEATYTATPISAVIRTESEKPSITATIEKENSPWGDGASYYLNVSGDYAYYHYECFYDGAGSTNNKGPSGDTSESRIYILGGSEGFTIRAFVTPYNSNGTAGDVVSISYTTNFESRENTAIVRSCEKYGTIYSPSGSKIDGFAASYVIDGGAVSYIRHDLTHGWHITAVNQYISGGITWYELYDSDDGDYYGWVDSNFISFY